MDAAPVVERRSTYFVFQGLLTIILLLFYFYRKEQIDFWGIRLCFLAAVSVGLLWILARVPAHWLENPKAQGLWFLVDILLASVTLYWIQQPTSDLYLAYFLVIFGTALTQSMAQSFLVATMATIFYTYLSWHTTREAPQEFWLRLPFLWIIASITGLLSRDTREAEKKQEDGYRERMLHLERLAVLGQVAAEIAHRIKAPLTTIRVHAEVLAHQKDIPPKRRSELKKIETEVDHCKHVLQKLLTLGRIEELEFEPMDLTKTVLWALDALKPQLQKHHIKLRTEKLQGHYLIHGDPVLLTEAVTAVLQNAIEAMPDGGSLSVDLHQVWQRQWWPLRHSKPPHFELRIQDTGMGIAPESIETIFRPFFTTKRGQGNGLGLSSALRILDKHGGTIRASSQGPGSGSTFVMTFPSQKAA